MADIVERLHLYAGDDHERLCQGREYSCSCGYDDRRDPLLKEAAFEIGRLLNLVADARTESMRLRAALREILGWHDYSNDMHKPIEVRAAYMRARAALEGRT